MQGWLVGTGGVTENKIGVLHGAINERWILMKDEGSIKTHKPRRKRT